ncbi:MAG: TIGR00269 family protein [Candidatus Diapherotrites archaeon]|uniref:TIGR00269 family protein n=1 Tax=Candidatus Iainarchaeum sp. TaxID=3101447 RepID=A0A8T4LAV1_9ARCH|nr:TIGR00269 family protein [Candidatus Diapherotrites archaeon]
METKTCERCQKTAKVHVPYGPHWFCAEHFNHFFENRFRETIRKHNLVRYGEKILIALSGGKDSMVLLHQLHKHFGKQNELHCLIIDEGIPGYRDKAIRLATDYCKQLGVPFTVVSHEKEFGVTNAQVASTLENTTERLGKSVCSYCGTFRKTLMNKYAKQLGAQKLATGHNLDDESQSVLMNVFDNDVQKLLSLSPKADHLSDDLVVPRIKPLYETPEKDIITFASLNEIPHYSDECCPYSYKAKRNDFRQLLNSFEHKYPGTKHSVLRFLQDIQHAVPAPGKKSQLKPCPECSEPATGVLCQACQKKKIIRQYVGMKKNKIKVKPIDALTCNETKGM